VIPEDLDVFIGLDVGKSEHHATLVAAGGEVIAAQAVRNEQSALEALLELATTHGRPSLVVDQPGSIAALTLAVCRDRGVPVAYLPGLVMRRAADLYPGESKTDARDSFVLADVARTRGSSLRWLDVTDELLAELRVLSGYDDDLAADSVRQANRLRDLLTSLHPPLEAVLGPRLDHPAVRALLARYPTATALRCAGRGAMLRLLRRRAPRSAERLTGEIVGALAAQTLTLPTEARIGAVIAELATELDRLQARRDRVATELEELFRSHPLGPVLISLPGVGVKTGARILAEVGDGSRFDSAAQFASYAGLAPVTRQSGTSIRGVTRSRRGNHRLKNALFLAAFCALRDPASRRFYDRKRAEGKKHNAAVICLARRRCDVILAMLKTATAFDPERAVRGSMAA
jgi:transposase